MKNLYALRILAASALAAALAAPMVSAQPATAYAAKPQITLGVGGHHGGVHAGIGVQLGKQAKAKAYGQIGFGHKPHVGIGIGFGKPHYTPKPYCAPKWIPGCWVTEARRSWVPATTVQVWVEPIYETKCDYFGHSHQVLVVPGHYDTVHKAGYWTTKRVRVWKPGHWA